MRTQLASAFALSGLLLLTACPAQQQTEEPVAAAPTLESDDDKAFYSLGYFVMKRAAEFGLEALDAERVVELHVAGMREGSDGYWHDHHQFLPPAEVLALTGRLARDLPALEAVTFEHHASASEEDFHEGLAGIAEVLAGLRK